MTKVAAVFAILLAGIAAAVWIDRPLPDAELTIIIPVEYNTLDPQRMSYSQDIRLAYGIYEPLVRWNNLSPDFEIVPALAESWTVSDDGLTYTFRLHEKAAWSNGSPVHAEHVIYSWQRAMLPDTAADYTGLFLVVRGAETYFDWRADQIERYSELTDDERIARFPGLADRDDLSRDGKLLEAASMLRDESDRRFGETVGLSAPDARTLVVELERPTAYFLDLCAFAPFSPVYPPLVESFVRLDPRTGRIKQDYQWTKPPLLVTNGPYRVREWRYKRAMLLERNPHYRIPGFARSATVKVLPITDNNTSVLAYETGAADWHTDVRVAYMGDLLAAGERRDVHALTTFGTYFWSFNCRPTLSGGGANPFHDPAVRRAFSMAVDKSAISERVTRGGEQAARVFVPPGSIAGFDSPEGLPFDPERAVAELRDAGWFDRNGDGVPDNDRGEPFPTVEMLYSTASYHKDVAIAMGRMWEQTLGVRTKLDGKETKVYKDQLKRQDYMVARGGWFGDYGDPTTFLQLHRTGDGNNDRRFSDPYFDDLLDRAEDETDAARRMDILEEAERYAMDEMAPILPIFHYNWFYMYEPPTTPDGRPNPGGLRGMSDHPRLVQYLWQIEVVPPDAGATP